MTTLNKDSMMVSAAMTDAFGASVPTTEAGLEKESNQTGIYIASSVDYTLFLKNAAGNWVQYASIAGARKDITVPWGDNTAAFFKCDDADANLYVHRKTGNILYDSTPENTGDDQNTLLTSAGAAAQDAQNYTFPAADGTAGQVLVTDGSGALSFADQSGGGSGPEVVLIRLSADFNLDFTGVNAEQRIPFDTVDHNTFGSSVWDTSAYEFVIPETGYYYVNLGIFQTGVDNDNTSQYQVRVRGDDASNLHAGGIALSNYYPETDDSELAIGYQLDKMVYLTAGNKLYISMTNIGTNDTDSRISSFDHITYLGIYKLK
jgi:hypothetical protein